MYAAAIPTSLIIALLELRPYTGSSQIPPAETNKEPDDDILIFIVSLLGAIAIGVPIAWHYYCAAFH